ncbi:MAG: flavin reductase family protein [Candidatus Eisenbacteria bacterium]|nr:flavin reductase family protein [Candidatus Eisenbacteria bacterium]
MRIDLNTLTHDQAYKLMISALVPRPIAFISTVGEDGGLNLAPFSFFMGVGSRPPMLAVSVEHRPTGPKDTVRNIRANREFVVNMVVEEIAEQMNLASGDYPYGVDEFEVAGLTPCPSAIVKPPGVEESPVRFECHAVNLMEVGKSPNTVIFGEILCIHVRDDLYLTDKMRVDTPKLGAVGRLGGPQYCRVNDIFEMIRPKVK